MQLAELVDLSEDQISNIERGKNWVGEQTFSLLADALSVSQESLFDYSENEAFLKQGGLKVRAPRKSAPLIIRRKGHALIQMPLKKKRSSLSGRKPRPRE